MMTEEYNKYDYPVCPDSGEHMVEVTQDFAEIPSHFEVWESPESGSLFISIAKHGRSNISDYSEEDLAGVRSIAKQFLV